MPGKLKIIAAIGAMVLTISGSWLFIADSATTPLTNSSALDQKTGSGLLDGMAFDSQLGPVGDPADIDDTLIFQNGMFVSTECERRCNYPASPYFVRKNGTATEFISETRCPYKNATIVWRGIVQDGQIEGVATWTNSRWYWTIVTEIAFSGSLSEGVSPLTNAN